MPLINLMQTANEHNTALMPAWHVELNMQDARAAFVIGFKQTGECLLIASPSLKKEHIIDMMKAALRELESGKETSKIIQLPG